MAELYTKCPDCMANSEPPSGGRPSCPTCRSTRFVELRDIERFVAESRKAESTLVGQAKRIRDSLVAAGVENRHDLCSMVRELIETRDRFKSLVGHSPKDAKLATRLVADDDETFEELSAALAGKTITAAHVDSQTIALRFEDATYVYGECDEYRLDWDGYESSYSQGLKAIGQVDEEKFAAERREAKRKELEKKREELARLERDAGN